MFAFFEPKIKGVDCLRRAGLLTAAALCISTLTAPAFAQGSAPGVPTTAAANDAATKTVQKAQEKAVDKVNMAGFNWGIGIATNFDTRGRRVANAVVDGNNIVRVEDSSSNATVSFVLEAHYFLYSWTRHYTEKGHNKTPCSNEGLDWINCTTFAHGPFVAVEMGGGANATTNSGPISGYALGWMLGMRHPLSTDTGSWNIGVGLRVTPNAKVLGDGLVANQPVPAGDALRFKQEPRVGVMLMSTFSF